MTFFLIKIYLLFWEFFEKLFNTDKQQEYQQMYNQNITKMMLITVRIEYFKDMFKIP